MRNAVCWPSAEICLNQTDIHNPVSDYGKGPVLTTLHLSIHSSMSHPFAQNKKRLRKCWHIWITRYCSVGSMQTDESHSVHPSHGSIHPLSLSPPPFPCALLRWRTWTTEALGLAVLQFSHLLHCWAFSLLCFHNCWAVSSGFAAHTYTHAFNKFYSCP